MYFLKNISLISGQRQIKAQVDEILTTQLSRNMDRFYEGFLPPDSSRRHLVYSIDINDYLDSPELLAGLDLATPGGFPLEKSQTIHYSKSPSKYQLNTNGGVPPQTIVYYTGGLESVVMSTMISGSPNITFVNVNGLWDYAQSLGIEVVESVLMALTPVLGAKQAMIGLEYGPQKEQSGPNMSQFSIGFVQRYAELLGISVVTPLKWLDKYLIFLRAINLGLDFCSCSSLDDIPAGTWCGTCFKCFQLGSMYLSLTQERELPFHTNRLSVGGITEYLRQMKEYMITGIDPFYGDNYALSRMVGGCYKTLEQLWEPFIAPTNENRAKYYADRAVPTTETDANQQYSNKQVEAAYAS